MLIRTSSLKPRWTPVHRETNSQGASIVKCARRTQMIMISNLVVITPGYYLHCLRRLADQEPRYHYTIPGKHSVLSHCVMIVALCNYTCSLCNKLEQMVEGQLNPIISIIIENKNKNESNDNSNCLLLLLLRMFYDNRKNLYLHMTNLHSTKKILIYKVTPLSLPKISGHRFGQRLSGSHQ